MNSIAIGRLAELATTKVQTIRYYEQIDLIQPFMRTEGGHRLYELKHVQRLKFIRHARELGFGIEEIRELLHLSDNPETDCSAADAIARSHLEQVEIRILKLQALKEELVRMISECGHGRVSQCRVIQVLSNHRYCATDH